MVADPWSPTPWVDSLQRYGPQNSHSDREKNGSDDTFIVAGPLPRVRPEDLSEDEEDFEPPLFGSFYPTLLLNLPAYSEKVCMRSLILRANIVGISKLVQESLYIG